MTALLLTLAWSLIMAAPTPPLTEAQKKAEYDLVKVKEVLTAEQYQQRDILPGWRPRPPLSDIERGAMEIVPGEDNPYVIFGIARVGGNGLTHAELDLLGKPSPSPRGFDAKRNVPEAYWYEQIDAHGNMTGIWTVVYKWGPKVEGTTLVGRLHMGPGVFHNVEPGLFATDAALKSLKKTLSKKLAEQAAKSSKPTTP